VNFLTLVIYAYTKCTKIPINEEEDMIL